MPNINQDKHINAESTRIVSVGTSDLLAILHDVQSANLTAKKTTSIINNGYKLTGFVVCHPETQERCIVEMSTCRWLTNEEMWRLMHTSKSPLTADE